MNEQGGSTCYTLCSLISLWMGILFFFSKTETWRGWWVIQDCVLSEQWSQGSSPSSPDSRTRGPSNCTTAHPDTWRGGVRGGCGGGPCGEGKPLQREVKIHTLKFGRMLLGIIEVVGTLEKNVLCYQRDLSNLICLPRLSWWSCGVWWNSGQWFPLGVRISY